MADTQKLRATSIDVHRWQQVTVPVDTVFVHGS